MFEEFADFSYSLPHFQSNFQPSKFSPKQSTIDTIFCVLMQEISVIEVFHAVMVQSPSKTLETIFSIASPNIYLPRPYPILPRPSISNKIQFKIRPTHLYPREMGKIFLLNLPSTNLWQYLQKQKYHIKKPKATGFSQLYFQRLGRISSPQTQQI